MSVRERQRQIRYIFLREKPKAVDQHHLSRALQQEESTGRDRSQNGSNTVEQKPHSLQVLVPHSLGFLIIPEDTHTYTHTYSKHVISRLQSVPIVHLQQGS